MKKIAVVLILGVAFCFLVVSPALADPLQAWQAGAYMNNSLKAAPLPIWKITQDGTVDSVAWVDATNPRFAVYDAGTPTVETDDIVLDKETGLVWERSPSTTTYDWYTAIHQAYNKYLGGRKGWRVPTIEELTSLVDPSNSPSLPTDHPFINVQMVNYWSFSTDANVTVSTWCLVLVDGSVTSFYKSNNNCVWCVRGGYGYDGY